MNTTTTTITKHRAQLAGGITATMTRAVYGATLSLDDTLRRLTLSLTPEQVAEMARDTDIDFDAPAYRVWSDLDWFAETAHTYLGWPAVNVGLTNADEDALRALAAAVQAELPCDECDGTGVMETYPPHGVEAYTGAGDVRVDQVPCAACGGSGLAAAVQAEIAACDNASRETT